jgi:uncharacterized protein (TIGR02246 family)
MKLSRLLLLGGLLFAGVLAGCASRTTPELAAGAALENYVQVLRRQDAAGLSELFEPEGSSSHADQKPIVGRPALRAFIESFASYKVLAHEMPVTSVVVQGNRVTQTGTYHQTVRTLDGQTIQVRGVFVAEWERQGDGRWLIRRMHTAPPGKDG